jgi:hypothetical protein
VGRSPGDGAANGGRVGDDDELRLRRAARLRAPVGSLGSPAASSRGEAVDVDEIEEVDSPDAAARLAQGLTKEQAKWRKAAEMVREVALNDAAPPRDKLALPHGFGVPGVAGKWGPRDLVKRVNRLRELVHPANHPNDEPATWKAAWAAIQRAYQQLAAPQGEEARESSTDPISAALDWELDDDELPRTPHHLSVTWRPSRKQGKGKKGKLPDRVRVTVVKAWIDKVKAHESLLRQARLLAAAPSLAVYGERGEQEKEYHGQGYMLWLSNGGTVCAVQACFAFLEACMLIHPDVNNSAELLVKPVGPSAIEERDPRPVAVIEAYPLKDIGKPHSYGYDNYDSQHRDACRAEFKAYYSTPGTTGCAAASSALRLCSVGGPLIVSDAPRPTGTRKRATSFATRASTRTSCRARTWCRSRSSTRSASKRASWARASCASCAGCSSRAITSSTPA